MPKVSWKKWPRMSFEGEKREMIFVNDLEEVVPGIEGQPGERGVVSCDNKIAVCGE